MSRPVEWGGLGFGYKWNMGWMHDTLDYVSKDPIYRKHHHGQIVFGLHYAFSENFILPLSHDEVVHGKRSILGRMPGDDWQRFADLRAYYAFMFGHPGKKLLFMGNEFAQENEWSHDRSLDWHLLDDPRHAGVSALVRDLNRLYRSVPALHELDCDGAGFEWLVMRRCRPQRLRLAAQGTRHRRRAASWWSISRPKCIETIVSGCRFPAPGARSSTPMPPPTAAAMSGTPGAIRTLDDGSVPEVSLVIPPLAAIFFVPER